MKLSKILYHFCFWLLAYFFWIFIFRNGTLVLTHTITIQFCYLAFISANYYFNALYTIPHLLNKKRYIRFAVFFISGIVLTALIRIPVSMLVITYVFKVPHPVFNYFSIFLDSFINILFWVVCILAAKMVLEKTRSQLYIEQIEKEKATNELNFLRAQFNPHFLFNSINSIYGHIDKNNKDARDMLLVFSEMLRYQLYECNVEQIGLDSEINYIKNYIAIQKGRIDERIVVNFHTDEISGQVMVAPLLFITFIENAFKYVGFNEDKQNHIDICLKYHEGNLIFKVFNTKDAFVNTSERSSGLGIANTKRRLEILYPNRHQLHISNNNNDYKVTLNLYNV
ncbi:sensor histidine kinase [Mucilaginibacter boryungensis]|uniref:Histidine kinase n=1 Tax=Mucilaginibacter boryungensis TaxID=768480 RepID=A0ABR9XDQ3_9SPHI|nr:histidine kinase [Mucilaginibacter boryungensis]MBE9665523.1 histidine kinase [Mucilaginibacter boryungensis]